MQHRAIKPHDLFDVVLELGLVRFVGIEVVRIEMAVNDRVAVIVARLVDMLRRQR